MDDRDAWALRPWIMAAIGGVAGLLVWLLLDDVRATDPWAAARAGTAGFVAAAATLFGFTFERVRPLWSILFALVTALVVAFITYWNGPFDNWGSMEGWRAVCIGLSVAIAAPLFQAARDHGARVFPYAEVHGHAWTNVVIGFAAWLFTGVVFLLAWLLSALFDLIGIDLIETLLRKEWFVALLMGIALGSAVGLLRERDRLVGLLRNVVVAVLAVLTPVLAAGLLLFLLSLPFTGLAPLWQATKSTTPILLSCVIGALILANAVIGNGEAEESRAPLLRWGALGLAVVMAPFAVIAAVSTGARIDQYGFTPQRLWALVFVIVATVYGLVYIVAVARGRLGWPSFARTSNLHLAFGLCGLALFLALPILSFNAISTRDQLARLESGKVRPDQFSWESLAFDFGDSGRAALKRLATSPNLAIRAKAAEALKADSRWALVGPDPTPEEQDAFAKRIRVLPQPVPLPPGLVEAIGRGNAGDDDDQFVLLYRPGERSAVLISSYCGSCAVGTVPLYLGEDGLWQRNDLNSFPPKVGGDENAARKADYDTLARADPAAIEVREIKRRQVFVNGRPVGEDFE